jgi:hypothetical protein
MISFHKLYKEVEPYFTLISFGGVGIAGSIWGFFSPIVENLGLPLSILLGIGISFFALLMILKTFGFDKSKKPIHVNTYAKIHLEKNTIECSEANNLTYRYRIDLHCQKDGSVVGNKVEFVCFFHEKVQTDSVIIKAINGSKPSYSNNYYQHDGCWLTFENLPDGHYLIEFNHYKP